MSNGLWRGVLAAVIVAPAIGLACGDSTDPDVATPPPGRLQAYVLDRGPVDAPSVALLFDVSGDAGRTKAILRALHESDVRATFGLTGLWAEQNRDVLFSIASEGHQVINGTYDGRSWTGASSVQAPMTAPERALTLSRAEVTVYRYTSQSTRPYFRPPNDDVDDSVLHDAAINGYGTVVLWTISAEETPPSEISANAGPGTIIAARTDDLDAQTLASIIDSIRARGFDFVSIGEMSP